jgi:hypothetical protein
MFFGRDMLVFWLGEDFCGYFIGVKKGLSVKYKK